MRPSAVEGEGVISLSAGVTCDRSMTFLVDTYVPRDEASRGASDALTKVRCHLFAYTLVDPSQARILAGGRYP